MLFFLMTIVEQLDLAREHITKGGVHDARFGLMLTDNVIELTLHQIAKDQSFRIRDRLWRQEKYEHQAQLDKALGRSFNDKLSFALRTKLISKDVSQTIGTLHYYRNELYHVGLKHEEILPSLSKLYFNVACEWLTTFKPAFMGWSSSQKVPDRAKKYFGEISLFDFGKRTFSEVCTMLAMDAGYDSKDIICALAEHFEETISDFDRQLDFVAEGLYEGQQRTRTQTVIECQAWPISFSDEGKEFAKFHGFRGNIRDLVAWIGINYPIKYRKDPIPNWRRRAQKLRIEPDIHVALNHYHSFMVETAQIRDSLNDAAVALDDAINEAIDRARGK